jgi:hypothetical protein
MQHEYFGVMTEDDGFLNPKSVDTLEWFLLLLIPLVSIGLPLDCSFSHTKHPHGKKQKK